MDNPEQVKVFADSAEQAEVFAKSDQFHKELTELVRKYDIHAGWFLWTTKEITEVDRTAAVMSYGCSGCLGACIAVGVARLRGTVQEMFTETMEALVNEEAKVTSFPYDSETMDKIH
jgi:hypothetical protein